MSGILTYAAPRMRNLHAVTYGIVSAGIASLVCVLPLAINGEATLLQLIFARPRGVAFCADLGMLIVLVPTLAMIMLPLLGILFAALSVTVNRRDCKCAMLGVVVNISGLIAGVGATILH